MEAKRLALEQEKLALDKQLLRAEKKHLKQQTQQHQAQLAQYQARIQQLEQELSLKQNETNNNNNDDGLVRELKQELALSQQNQQDLQERLSHQQDEHDAQVEELQGQIEKLQQDLTMEQTTGKGMGMSPAKASATSREIQQYKNKLQSLRLAMEVAVRRTETEWKGKVDDLEVQLATQEGEYEELMQQQTQEFSTQILQLQEEIKYEQESKQELQTQMETTIERLKSGQEVSSTELATRDAELGKANDKIRMLEKAQTESTQKQEAIQREAQVLIALIKTTEPTEAPDKLADIQQQALFFEQSLTTANSTKAQKSRPPLVRKISSRASSRVVDARNLRHVENFRWESSHQQGVYTGTISEQKDEPHGRGKLVFDNGDVYEGGFKHGRRHGQGVYKWANGDLYTGPWKSNRREGVGCFVWNDGRIYDGSYVKGKREGMGEFTWPYGAKYRGGWVGNKRNGTGVYTHSDGRTYSGAYKDDRPHGSGILTDPKGFVIHEGTWARGEFVGED